MGSLEGVWEGVLRSRAEYVLRQTRDVTRNVATCEELSDLITERVAVVVKQVIAVGSEEKQEHTVHSFINKHSYIFLGTESH